MHAIADSLVGPSWDQLSLVSSSEQFGMSIQFSEYPSLAAKVITLRLPKKSRKVGEKTACCHGCVAGTVGPVHASTSTVCQPCRAQTGVILHQANHGNPWSDLQGLMWYLCLSGNLKVL